MPLHLLRQKPVAEGITLHTFALSKSYSPRRGNNFWANRLVTFRPTHTFTTHTPNTLSNQLYKCAALYIFPTREREAFLLIGAHKFQDNFCYFVQHEFSRYNFYIIKKNIIYICPVNNYKSTIDAAPQAPKGIREVKAHNRGEVQHCYYIYTLYKTRERR